MKVLVLVTLLLPICLALPKGSRNNTATQGRIVGGNFAQPGQFPHQVSIQFNGEHKCGGAIIAADSILTAAQCLRGFNPSQLQVFAGQTNLAGPGVRRQGRLSIMNSDFDPIQAFHDIAVLKLAEPLPIGGFIKVAPMRGNPVEEGESLTVSGWGKVSYPGMFPYDLRYVNLEAVDLHECLDELANAGVVTNGHVCAGGNYGQGTCQGDAGSPLIDENGGLVGITSWGVPCAQGKPDVFTAVSYYLGWIIGTKDT